MAGFAVARRGVRRAGGVVLTVESEFGTARYVYGYKAIRAGKRPGRILFGMYTLELDLKLGLIPMVGDGAPVCLTRKLTLPFPAHEGLVLFANGMDQCPNPLGLHLSEVVWEMDREVFLAETHVQDDIPIGMIAATYQEWIDRGWTPGSCHDPYPDRIQKPPAARHRRKHPSERMDFEELEDMQRTPAKGRPEWYMGEFRAVVRYLYERGSEPTAFAMDRTGMLRQPHEPVAWKKPEPLDEEWRESVGALDKLSPAQRKKWESKVRRFPRLFAPARRD
jgi:hypothetical protein